MDRADNRLRPVDLARAAGVSTQQIRNYMEQGILPRAARTAAGYRTFYARHRQALLTYRALATGYGWGTARSIMASVHAGDVPQALAHVDAAHAALDEQRRSLQAAREALETVAGEADEAASLPRSAMRIGDVAGHLGVRTSALRVWESAGLLIPSREAGTQYRRFDRTDLRDARMIKILRQDGYPLPEIRQVLDGLRHAGDTGALQEVIAQRRAKLTHRTRTMLEGSSHLHAYLSVADSASDEANQRRAE